MPESCPGNRFKIRKAVEPDEERVVELLKEATLVCNDGLLVADGLTENNQAELITTISCEGEAGDDDDDDGSPAYDDDGRPGDDDDALLAQLAILYFQYIGDLKILK